MIVDPVDAGDKVRVDGGKLQIGGEVELTGPVTISGAVNARPALPARPFVYTSVPNGPNEIVQFIFGPVPASQKLAITSVTVYNLGGGGGRTEVTLESVPVNPSQPGCSPAGDPEDDRIFFKAEPGELVHVEYPSPFVFPLAVDDQPWCLTLRTTEGAGEPGSSQVAIVGFQS